MGKKITLAIFGGIVGFGLILALVGVFLGGNLGSYGYEDGYLVYREGGTVVQTAQAPRWVANLARRANIDGFYNTSGTASAEFTSGNGAFTSIPASDLKKLDIDIEAGYVVIEAGEPGDDFGLSVDGKLKYTSSYENGTWTLKAELPGNLASRGFDDGRFWVNGEDLTTTFTLTVPASFDTLELNLELGEAYADDLFLKNLECSTGMGAITLNNIITEKTDLSASMGAIDAYELTTGDCNITCEMGAIELNSSSVNGRFTANCEMGSIYADIAAVYDYGWHLRSEMGSISLDGHSASGMDSEASGGNSSAANYFDLTCGMGSIDIEFN